MKKHEGVGDEGVCEIKKGGEEDEDEERREEG